MLAKIGVIVVAVLVLTIVGMVLYKAISESVKFIHQHWLLLGVILATVASALFATIETAGMCLLIGGLIGVTRWVYNRLFKKK